MTDGDGLLRAILANPDEDTPRAMFLDWLRENADTVPCARCHDKCEVGWSYLRGVRHPHPCPECTRPGWTPKLGFRSRWAEFIRVQCERELIEAIEHTCRPDPNGGPIDEGETECPACGASWVADDLRQTEFELLATLAERLAVPALHTLWPGVSHDVNYDGRVVSVVAGLRTGAIVFRRGHVAEVECSLRDWYGVDVCDNCGGTGELYDPAEPCPDCGGQWEPREDHTDRGWSPGDGRTAGRGPAVLRKFPVTTVRLADCEPFCHTGRSRRVYGWIDGDHGPTTPYAIPPNLWLHIDTTDMIRSDESHGGRDGWESPEKAHAVLGAAAVAWARSSSALAEQSV